MEVIGSTELSCGRVLAKAGDTIVGTYTIRHLAADGREVKTEVFRVDAKIKKGGWYDRVVLVKFTPEEAESLGLKSAYGTFVGEAT